MQMPTFTIRTQIKQKKSLKCAKSSNVGGDEMKGIIALVQYPLKDLLEVYDNFQLVKSRPASNEPQILLIGIDDMIDSKNSVLSSTDHVYNKNLNKNWQL